MLQFYFNYALQFAFPALVVSAVVYFAASAVLSRRSHRKLVQLQTSEQELRRKLYVEKYQARSTSAAPVDTDDSLLFKPRPETSSVLRPRAPASSDKPFGSSFMTMSDLNSRIKGPSSSCSKGSCCG
ncbi:hypothetical protein IWW56_000287 [Coemansia sp. RSA 2131]|nr:hypothetical protein IWW56_000287 [Coemansia sp. RSA 2131]